MISNQIEPLEHSRCATGSNGFGKYDAMSERKQVDSCLEWKKHDEIESLCCVSLKQNIKTYF